MARVLVTGATGFVGRRVCNALRKTGHDVVAVVREARSEHSLLEAQEIIPMGELGPDSKWDPKLLNRIDAIIHLAARVHVMNERAADPVAEFERVNVGLTRTLARAAVGRVGRFVYVSSLHAMRTLTDELLTESSRCEPDGPYAHSKLRAETVVRQIESEANLETTILRPPPVYGPGHLGRLMSLFKFVSHGLPMPLGGLNNRRSLIFVDNLADALVECALQPKAASQTFLVSDGENVSLSDLIRRMGLAWGRRALLIPAPVWLMRTAGRVIGKSSSIDRLFGSLAVDSRSIREQLGWQPKCSLDAGLRATAEWMKGAA